MEDFLTEKYDQDLSLVQPGTKFVIDKKSKKVLYIFRQEQVKETVQQIILDGYIKNKEDILLNSDGDIIIIKNRRHERQSRKAKN